MRWRSSIPLCITMAVLGSPSCRRASPTDSSGPRSPRPTQGITASQQGEAYYKAEDYPGAAWVFEQTLAGAIPGDRQRAQFWLGKSYFRLDDFTRSAAVMMEIAQTPDHPFQALSLPWLVSLHDEMPDDRAVLQLLGELGPDFIDHDEFTFVRGDLLTAIGEYQLRTRRPEQALATLQQVQEHEGDFGRTNLWAGRAAAQLGRDQLALDYFRIAATWNAPSRKERRKRERQGRLDPQRERVLAEAAAELERLGQPLE